MQILADTPKVVHAPTWSATIWIAGDMADIRRACREHTMNGLCVSITPTSFVFTGGAEEGAAIGLINYPRFPKEFPELEGQAIEVAAFLLNRLRQQSCCVVMPTRTLWLSRRADQ